MRSILSRAEIGREALDLCLSLGSLGRDTGGPIVELLLVLANLIIRRRNARARGSGGALQLGTRSRVGDDARYHTASIIGRLSPAHRLDRSFHK